MSYCVISMLYFHWFCSNKHAIFPSVFWPVQLYESINNTGFKGVFEKIVDPDQLASSEAN